MSQGTHTVIFVGDSLPEDAYVVGLFVGVDFVGKNFIKVNQLVGLKNEKLGEKGVTIYPNPTSGLITVTSLLQESARITVYNALGELVYEEETADHKIDLSGLPSGAYMFHVTQGKTTIRKKVIKL